MSRKKQKVLGDDPTQDVEKQLARTRSNRQYARTQWEWVLERSFEASPGASLAPRSAEVVESMRAVLRAKFGSHADI